MEQALINILRRMHDNNNFEPYLRYIYFPSYKNLAPFTRIDFSFPITALVGANGSNKSSVLKALYATTENVSLADLWFSTKIDPIDHNNEAAPCFVYGYKHQITDLDAQVLYIMYNRKDDPDYWETAKPVKKYNMNPMPSDPAVLAKLPRKSRWVKYNKKAVYLTFRDSISAFDKYFYYGDIAYNQSKPADRKKALRRNSSPLKHAIDNGLLTYKFDQKERIIDSENFELSSEELKEVSKILGTNYLSIRWIKHTFFKCVGYTCKIKKNNIDYSEAFAGSGEFAVIRMVTQITRSPNNSLILLDEPEVSLHPGAQERLLTFLANSVIKKKHQIVIATHSPAIVRGLPSDAIKVFTTNNFSNQIELIKQDFNPNEAFYHIGEPVANKKTIIVEDILAKHILDKVLSFQDSSFKEQFDIVFYPGGASIIWSQYALTHAIAENKNVFIVFDGDQRPVEELIRPEDIPESRNPELQNLINAYCQMEIKIPREKTGSIQHIASQRKFIGWVFSQVKFLPGDGNPEQFIWENMICTDTLLLQDLDQHVDYKKRFEIMTQRKIGDGFESREVLFTQREMLNTIPFNSDGLSEILNLLRAIANS